MRKVQLSKRMEMVAKMVDKGSVVADVGCDHAYVSIYLIENKIAIKTIAMDIRKGPLDKAKENIKQHNLEAVIETRLSDGLDKLLENEVDTVIIAGMGGQLIINILKHNINVVNSLEYLILQPQSEISLVRKFLINSGYEIVKEDMVIDSDKFYNVLKVRINENKEIKNTTKECLKYGEYLLNNKNQVLKAFLSKELDTYTKIKNNISTSKSDNSMGRIKELNEEIKIIREAQNYYE